MKILVTGKKIRLTEGINGYIDKKFSKLEKLLSEDTELRVTVSANKKEKQKVEVTLDNINGHIVRAEDVQEDLYSAIDVVCDKLNRQIVKYKHKFKSRASGNDTIRFENFNQLLEEEIEEVPEDAELVFERRKKFDIRPMSPEEAVLQMNLLGHDFFLFKDGRNVFVNPGNPQELSEEAYYFVGGLLAHSKEMALITNPIVNSYKRLVPGYEAPTELTWTKNNQNSLVRIPGSRGMETRIELRSPDAAANPYLVFAVCLAAGLDGINKKIYPTKSSSRELSETDQKTMKIENLPGNLNEAIDYFEQSDWIKEVLGTEFCKEYAEAKKKEWLRYTREISAWEIEEYLYRI